MNVPIISAQNGSKSCRICLDNDNPKDFIRPCLCSGGSAYVHRKCLDNWRSLNKDGRAFKVCEVCHFEYVIEPVVDDPAADKKRLLLFRFLVTRDITLIILLIQAFIIGLAFLLLLGDRGSHNIKDLYPSSMSPFGAYYLSSLILFFAFLGLFGLIGLCCGMIKPNQDDQCNCVCYQCFFCYNFNSSGGDSCGNCNCDCNGGGGGGGGGGEGLLVALLVIIVLFAIMGVVFGIILSIIITKQIIERHTKKLWLRQETKKYVVKDFEGRLTELRDITAQRRTTNLSTYNGINNGTRSITPSAPVHLVSDDYIKYTADSKA